MEKKPNSFLENSRSNMMYYLKLMCIAHSMFIAKILAPHGSMIVMYT